MAVEITEADRDTVATVLDMHEHDETHVHRIEALARLLAEQRERLTRVDLYDEVGSTDIAYGTDPELNVEWDVPGLIAYSLRLPSGHIFRLSPDQLRELAREVARYEGD